MNAPRALLMPAVRRTGVGILCLLMAVFVLDRVLPPPLERGEALSVMVTDRAGKPLRAFPTEAGRWRFAADLDRTDPLFVEALLQVEDKRFYRHGGVDWAAMVRAGVTSLKAGRVVSGGSTITMQTARLLEPRPRTVRSKLIEMIRAQQIEARLSKPKILELYLTLTPYGGNLEGVRAASLAWFGREPTALGDDEIALLIALPQAPEARRPDRRPEAARAGRAAIATKLETMGLLDARRRDEVDLAVLPGRHALPSSAWHGTARARKFAGAGDVGSTLDAGLQADLEALISARVNPLEDEVQIAAMVIDIPTRAVRAVIGSASRARDGGWIDLTQQARSPGSALKPFIYAMTFDDGIGAPETVISDLPKRFAAYQPDNFDRRFRGDVTLAEALQHSLNVPAVMALDRIGAGRFAAQLRLAGANPRIHGGAGQKAGLALALGGAGLTLEELAVLYAALGDGGVAKPLVWDAREEAASAAGQGRRFVGEAGARDVLKILSEAPGPAGRAPGRLTKGAPQIAFKTGTSYGFRDAWAAGVAGDTAIVVWVGRADGAPRPGHVGRGAALPILFDIADRAHARLAAPAGNAGRFRDVQAPQPQAALARFATNEAPPEILFPPRGAELWAGTVDGRSARAFVLAGRGAGGLSWFVDGVPCELDDGGLPVWVPPGAGFYTISAVDEEGRATRRHVRVLM